MVLAIVFSTILALVHFFSHKIEIKSKLWNTRLISFVAGISVTYVFLSLLPEAYGSFERFDRLIFVFIVAGFTAVHVAEKYFYKNSHRKSELQLNLKEVHSASFFLYYFLLGTILVDLSSQGPIRATLFFIPILFYAAVGLVSLNKIHTKVVGSKLFKAILSTSTIAGALLAEFLFSTRIIFDTLFAFVIGAFIYIALIDFIPKEKNGNPLFFTIGTIIYTILITTLVL